MSGDPTPAPVAKPLRKLTDEERLERDKFLGDPEVARKKRLKREEAEQRRLAAEAEAEDEAKRARIEAEEAEQARIASVKAMKEKELAELETRRDSGILNAVEYAEACEQVHMKARRSNEKEYPVKKKKSNSFMGENWEETKVYLNTIDEPNYIRFNDEEEISLRQLSIKPQSPREGHPHINIYRTANKVFTISDNGDLYLALYDTMKGAYGGDLSWGGGKKKRLKYSKKYNKRKHTKRRKSNKIKHTKRRKSKKKTKRRR